RLFDRTGSVMYQSASLDSFPFRHVTALKSVLTHRHPAETRRVFGTRPAMGVIFPLEDQSGQLIGAIQVLQLESYMQQDDQRTRRFIVVLSLLMMLATLSIVFLL